MKFGGLSGIAAGILLVIVFLVGMYLAPEYVGPEESLRQYLQDSTPSIANAAVFVVLSLILMPFYLSVYRGLRAESAGFALLGTVFGILAIVLVVVFTTLSSASIAVFSERYDAASTAADRLLMVTLFDSSDSLLWAGLVVPGFFIFALSILSTSAAMLGSRHFRKAYAWMGVLFGLVIIVGLPGFLPVSSLVPVLVVVWFVSAGWQVYKLSGVL